MMAAPPLAAAAAATPQGAVQNVCALEKKSVFVPSKQQQRPVAAFCHRRHIPKHTYRHHSRERDAAGLMVATERMRDYVQLGDPKHRYCCNLEYYNGVEF
jgi:hypothetical protein